MGWQRGKHLGTKICEECRKLRPKKEIKFNPKANKHLCMECRGPWESGKFERGLPRKTKVEE